MLLILRKDMKTALLILIGFHCCLRIGELLQLQSTHVHVSGAKGCIIFPNAKTSGRRMVTEYVSICDPVFLALLAHFRPTWDNDGPLFRGSPGKFRHVWSSLLLTLQLDVAQYSPYALRRGGATHFFVETGSLDRTLLRGRWLAIKSARIYLEDARAQLLACSMPAVAASHIGRLNFLWKAFPVG